MNLTYYCQSIVVDTTDDFGKSHASMEEPVQMNEISTNNEGDTFQCGKCKTQFQDLSTFIDHKRFQCFQTNVKAEEPLVKTVDAQNNLSVEAVLPNAIESFDQTDNPTAFKAEDSQSDQVVSFLVNNDNSLVGNPVNVYYKPVILFNQASLPYIVGNDPAYSNVTNQVFFTPEAQNTSVIVNNQVEEPPRELILTSDTTNQGNVVYSLPNGSELMLTSEVSSTEPVDQVILTANISENEKIDNEAVAHTESDSVASQPLDTTSIEFENPQTNKTIRTNARRFGVDRPKGKFPCSYCGKLFDKPFGVEQHERIHTRERPFQCIICGRAFTQKANVKQHMITHKVWPQGKHTLRLPLRQNADNQNVSEQMCYSCPYCSMSFESYSLHRKHLTVHSNFKVYRCIQKGCDETFSDLDEFLTHSKMHSTAEFQCRICLKSFTNLEELGAHQYDHDVNGKDKSKNQIKLKCDLCNAKFKSVESLKNHLAVDTHKYECVHCESVFNSERYLRRHLSVHLDISQSGFNCPDCNKTFRTQKLLKNHSYVHMKEKPFNCEYCKKQFSAKYRLKRHMAVHFDRRFECLFKVEFGCDRTFYRKDKLREHVNTHSRCRSRSCKICSKTYWSLAKLNQHMKRDHKTDREKQVLKCGNCSQTFRKEKQLMQHYCTVDEKNFKSRHRKPGDKHKTQEAVSNIEIIMVPYVSECNIRENLQ